MLHAILYLLKNNVHLVYKARKYLQNMYNELNVFTVVPIIIKINPPH